MSSSDRPPEAAWSQFSIDQISILIRLHRLLSATGPYERAIDDLIEPLGFGSYVSRALVDDYRYQYKVRDILAQTLETLKTEYQNLYNIHDDDIDSQEIHQAMFGGLLSLKNLALLKNPFAVAKVESDLKLPVTGDLRFFQKNWNRTYYSQSRCGEFNDPRTCMEKAARLFSIER